MRGFLIAIIYLISASASANSSKCETELTYGYTYSAMIYVSHLSKDSFNQVFELDSSKGNSREEVARDVVLEPIFLYSSELNSMKGFDPTVLLMEEYIAAQGVEIDRKMFRQITGYHSKKSESTYGNYVTDLVNHSVIGFSVCH